MTSPWGCDSVAPIDSSTSQGTLAHYVINYWFAYPPPRDTIIWWGRYFSAFFSPYSTNDEAVQLINEVAVWSGNRYAWIAPLCDPPTNTVQYGSSSDGQYWGNNVCGNLSYWLGPAGANTYLPGNHTLYTYLDIESTLSSAFWSGWSPTVYGYSFAGSLPYYEAAYCNPYVGGLCNQLNGGTGNLYCYGVWSSEPEPGGGSYCQSPGPSWAAASCGGHLTSFIWQYSEAQQCNGAMVDLDLVNQSISGPYGNGLMDFMIYCA